jgi:retron-type reverse transcriptase
MKEKELLTLINTIIEQHYLHLNNKFLKQYEGLAMGAPTSAILAENFIQYLEHKIINKILNKHQIIYYFRYVDDILITHIEYTLHGYRKHIRRIQYNTSKIKIHYRKRYSKQDKLS